MAVKAARMGGVSHMHLLCLHWGCVRVVRVIVAHAVRCHKVFDPRVLDGAVIRMYSSGATGGRIAVLAVVNTSEHKIRPDGVWDQRVEPGGVFAPKRCHPQRTVPAAPRRCHVLIRAQQGIQPPDLARIVLCNVGGKTWQPTHGRNQCLVGKQSASVLQHLHCVQLKRLSCASNCHDMCWIHHCVGHLDHGMHSWAILQRLCGAPSGPQHRFCSTKEGFARVRLANAMPLMVIQGLHPLHLCAHAAAEYALLVRACRPVHLCGLAHAQVACVRHWH
eukprot:3940379-Rhodomonas_salina.1